MRRLKARALPHSLTWGLGTLQAGRRFQDVTRVDSRSAHHGVSTVLAEFVRVFSADSEKFDCNKFHKYIEQRRDSDGPLYHGSKVA